MNALLIVFILIAFIALGAGLFNRDQQTKKRKEVDNTYFTPEAPNYRKKKKRFRYNYKSGLKYD